MNSVERSRQLSDLLFEELLPLIESDYVLYGLPYYSNIGDTLIWEGELELFKHTKYKCKGVCGWNDYPQRKLPSDQILVIQGGGYFGDLWRPAWENVLNELVVNKDNRIILLPNSICYNDAETLEKDIKLMEGLRHLTLCARDLQSYNFAKKHFSSHDIRLLPDLAFCINPANLNKWKAQSFKSCLYLKRNDKEFVEDNKNNIPSSTDVSDWPTMETPNKLENQVERFAYYYHRLDKKMHIEGLTRLYDSMYYWIYRRQMLSRGVKFISAYQKIYSTRLHGMILAGLLGKETYFIDNSYGKISSLYNTWLADVNNIYPL